jgi:hypothetical protein
MKTDLNSRAFRRCSLRGWSAAILVTATIAGTLGAIWLYREQSRLLLDLLNRAANSYEIEVLTIAGVAPGLRGATVNSVTARHAGSDTMITLANLSASYDPRQVLGGRLQAVRIEQALISINSAQHLLNANAGRNKDFIWLENLRSAPMESLSIDNLMLSIDDETMVIALDLKSATLTIAEALVTLDVAPDSSLKIEHLTLDMFELGLTELSARQSVHLEISPEHRLGLRADDMHLNLPLLRNKTGMAGATVQLRGVTADYADLTTQFDTEQLTLAAELTVSDLYTNIVSLNLWPMVFEQALTLSANQLSGAIQAIQYGIVLFDATLQHDLTNRQGNGHLSIPNQQFTPQRSLSSILSPLPVNVDLLAGRLGISADLDWNLSDIRQPVVSGPFVVQAQGLSGYYNDVTFTDLGFWLDANLLRDWHVSSRLPGSLIIVGLDAGIAMQELSTRFELDTRTGLLRLDRPEAGVFGGRIGSERIEYSLADHASDFRLFVSDIDISQIMSLSAYEAVRASGLISGILPVSITQMTPTITAGMLFSAPGGGSIRYSGANNASGNPSMDLVYQALAHYNYQLLEAQVDYPGDGELLLAVRLEGVSPELNSGQRINLNLNISDNVPALLNSLQATRDITETLREQLRLPP